MLNFTNLKMEILYGKCFEFYGSIADLVDGKIKDPQRDAEITRHLNECEDCEGRFTRVLEERLIPSKKRC